LLHLGFRVTMLIEAREYVSYLGIWSEPRAAIGLELRRIIEHDVWHQRLPGRPTVIEAELRYGRTMPSAVSPWFAGRSATSWRRL